MTGIDPATVDYSNVGWPALNNVKEALDTTMHGGYLSAANAGYTGVPIYGNDARWDEGMALYSTDGHVYLVPPGYTAGDSYMGFKFVISPCKANEWQYIGTESNTMLQYGMYRFETGASQFEVQAYSFLSFTGAHLQLGANYGHVKLHTGTALNTVNSVRLIGFDGCSGMYDDATSGRFRALYADEDGDIVIAESDTNKRHEEGNGVFMFAGGVTGNQTGGQFRWSRDGYNVTLSFLTDFLGWGATGLPTLVIKGLPLNLFPDNRTRLPLEIYDDVTFGSGYGRGHLDIEASSDGVTGCTVNVLVNGANGPEYSSSGWGLNSRRGILRQSVSYVLQIS